MKFLRNRKADASVEWLVVAVLVVAVVGSMIYSVANTTQTQGSGTDSWIGGIPAPSTP